MTQSGTTQANLAGGSNISAVNVNAQGAAVDAFGRLRVSNPYTLWSSTLLNDSHPLFWDDQEVSGTGTNSTYTANHSSVSLSVSATTAGRRVRQSKQRFGYQAGKSQKATMTMTLGEGKAGITKRVGLFDDENGVFLQLKDGVLAVVRRSYRTGTAVDTIVEQADWNVGSRLDIDTTKSQIFSLDMEWLGVGTVRTGFFINGNFFGAHNFHHANIGTGVYMTTPNLPIRYEIINDGTGEADAIECICSEVSSEGGSELTGVAMGITTAPTHVDADVADTTYAVLGVRLKSTHLDAIVRLADIHMISETADNFAWDIRFNPVVAGTFTYNDLANSPIQVAKGATANTVTNGTIIHTGLSLSSSVAEDAIETLLNLGSTISGTPDTMVLCVTPLSNTADIQGAMNLRFT